MGHKMITGGLMPGGRLRLEKLASLIEVGKLDVRHLSHIDLMVLNTLRMHLCS